MKHKLILICLASFLLNSARAQQNIVNNDTTVAVKEVINNMFTAMKNCDTVLLKTCFSNTVVFQTVSNKNGVVTVKDESIRDFVNSIGKQKPGSLDERIVFETVKVNKDLAIAWTPYRFYFNEKFSHEGVNSFQLVKFKEGWKIQYLIDTRYR